MAEIGILRASDGNGNASTATVQSTRSPMATTIQVNTTTNWPTKFIATMGTPHTFTDPVTSETITVISEATAVDFKGHLDGGNIEIDSIAPGYTDLGSSVGDIVIVKPTTAWADEIGDVLDVSLEDDGTLKDDTVDTDQIVDDAITTPKIDDGAVTPDKLGTGAATAAVLASENTTSTSYTDLGTTTDTVTVTIGDNGLALVCLSSFIINNVVTASGFVSVALSGANTQAANDNTAIQYQAFANGAAGNYGQTFLLTGLTAGSTTFKMKYRVSGSTGSFSSRKIAVIPL